jgi:hypothetical protein
MKIPAVAITFISTILFCSSCLPVQSATIEDPIEALAGKWDTQCMEKGCLMFTDVLIGDPDHPADLKHPEYITMAVAINRSDRKPAYFAFHLPPDADRAQGAFIVFAKTNGEGRNHKSTIDKSTGSHLNFVSCDKESCVARIPEGIIPAEGNGPNIDLLSEFLNENHILFLFTRRGEQYRTIKALFPFQRAYKNLLATELKQDSK